MRLFKATPLACVCVVLIFFPAPARADWLLSLYTGAAATSSNTLTVTPASGSPLTLDNVEYRGASSKSPIYYGYRVGFTPRGSRVGIEAEFTHAKAIAVDTHSTDLTAFQMTHGLNFVLGNVVFRSQPVGTGRVVLTARGGAGFTVPHVEGIFRGNEVSEYQNGGFGAQGTVGVEAQIVGRLYAIADARLTYARVRVDVPPAAVGGGFTTRHVDFGVAVHLP